VITVISFDHSLNKHIRDLGYEIRPTCSLP